jgi:hypothetical protein
MARPALHAGDAMAVKSPAIMAGVATKRIVSPGSERIIVPWYPAKKNSRFSATGPPSVPPN